MRSYIAAAGVLLAQSAMAQDAVIPAQPLIPLDQWFHPDDYPAASIRGAEEGDVSALLAVDPHGMVTGCRVTHSSGHPLLDRATCAIAVHRGRFTPAKDRQQRPIDGGYVISGVKWRMNGIGTPSGGPPIIAIAAAAEPNHQALFTTVSGAENTPITYNVTINPDGGFTDCTLSPSTGSAQRDSAICQLLTRHMIRPVMGADGNPVQSHVTGKLRWKIPVQGHTVEN
ncbi:energy transducer TonB [Sphingomonas echinoides]|uniref:energy transducer TonB n=1 Tax=Sphingomonas echinoides TaxID=59803 RepID=UPI002412FF48|nr:energy transducer TonB [Sphingomonas echinoides]